MKFIQLTISLISLIILPTCSFLDQTSPNDIPAADAITDAASAEAAVVGIYSAMQQNGYYGETYLLAGEGHTDNATTGGYQVLSLDQIGNRNLTGANVIVEDMWTSIYRVIANCNYVLRALPNAADLEPAQSKHLEGQVRALRALAHFDLLRYFGEHWNNNSAFGIPIIQSIPSISEQPTRSSVAQTYQFVQSELAKAAALLDKTQTDSHFITYWAVQALRARVSLYQKDMANASRLASEVIDSGSFTLLDSESYVPSFSARQTSESVFELGFDTQNRSGYNAATFNRSDAIRPELSYLASRDLHEFFDARPGDVRALLLNFDPAANDPTILPDGRSQKYRGESTRDNPAFILRYAELFLIRAEAAGRPSGLADLNYLRTHRGLLKLQPTDLSSDVEWQQALLDERRAEFHFEGHRYFDLARTGKTSDVLGIDAFRRIFPLPIRELAANPSLSQNPGY